ncbi:alpha/beta hydrolase [Ramlibacter henchirensis]|uniref:Alpha/beta hydrolase n=1 Tax=Ramlibacter henchirensis TaxID=204072 RepID=A0A4Z0BW27_9BURK|nr:alpha/beta hydrolase [Ramlibacter henchirensis]TFZ02560.1 alpha/beta hydrolase [Ramlibacter henchirensis]
MTAPALSHSFVTVDGCRTSLWRGGEGPPLLFLHGAQGVPAPLPFMNELAKRFEVLAPEHPGFGLTDVPPWLDNIHDVAYFYLDFLRALDLRGVYVVGQALGGWIAAEVAVRDTSRIARLALAGATGLHVPHAPTLDVFSVDDTQMADYLFHDPKLAAAARQRAAEAHASPIAKKNRQSLERLARATAFTDPHLHKWLHRIDVPVLLLWGEQDRPVPVAQGRVWESLIPGARLQLLRECGHLPHVEKSAEYVAALQAFAA